MPPRFAYWTILIDNQATAFRAREREELLPTLAQLKRTNENVAMKWFARGRLWASPDEERWATRQPHSGAGEKRGPNWRPGGSHEDPRARFAEAEKKRRQEKRARHHDARARREDQETRKPLSGHGGHRQTGFSRPGGDGRPTGRPPQGAAGRDHRGYKGQGPSGRPPGPSGGRGGPWSGDRRSSGPGSDRRPGGSPGGHRQSTGSGRPRTPGQHGGGSGFRKHGAGEGFRKPGPRPHGPRPQAAPGAKRVRNERAPETTPKAPSPDRPAPGEQTVPPTKPPERG